MSSSEPQQLEIRYTDSHAEACRLRDQGYEPIECAFGGHGSVLGPLAMDHHGTERHRPGVAIRACGEAYGACRDDPRFVVTGTPDADAALAIAALAALFPKEVIPPGFPDLVDRYDRDPIGLDLVAEPLGPLVLAYNQTNLPRGEEGFRQGVKRMAELVTEGLPSGAMRHILGMEKSRRGLAVKALRAILLPDGSELSPMAAGDPGPPGETPPQRVALVHGNVWGFDLWYRWAPVVVSYSARLQKVTIGCPNQETAERCFGPGGLMVIYPRLGRGWGGRETVGGSPRGVPLQWEDAEDVAERLARLLR